MLNLGVKKLLQKVEQNSTFYNNLSQPATSELLQDMQVRFGFVNGKTCHIALLSLKQQCFKTSLKNRRQAKPYNPYFQQCQHLFIHDKICSRAHVIVLKLKIFSKSLTKISTTIYNKSSKSP